MANSFDAELDAYIDFVLEDYRVPGAAIVVVKDGAVYLKSYGVKRVGAGDKVGENTAFLIASCSKAYTAAAIALLVDEGRIGWDDKVQRYLPEFTVYDPWITQNLTIRDLLTMRIGLKRQGIVEWGRNYDISHEEAFRRLQYTEPECGFREMHVNLNPAYTALSVIVERLSGLTFPDFVRQRISGPLGQTNTVSCDGFLAGVDDFAFPHVRLDGEIRALEEPRTGGRQGESCIYSSASDTAKWLQMHLDFGRTGDKRLISRDAMNEMYSPHSVGSSSQLVGEHFHDYGMGWWVVDFKGQACLRHDGGEFGMNSRTIVVHGARLGIAIYLNMSVTAAHPVIGYRLLEAFTGQEQTDWLPLAKVHYARSRQAGEVNMAMGYEVKGSALHSDNLEAYAGRYFNPGSGFVEIQNNDGVLEAYFEDGEIFNARLEHLGGDIFTFTPFYAGARARQADHGALLGELGNRARLLIENGRCTEFSSSWFGTFERAK
jgi:CubicO group peptidase (beta-lactamase class C family)